MEMHHSAAVKELSGHGFRSGNHMSVLTMNKKLHSGGAQCENLRWELLTSSDEGETAMVLLGTGPIPVLDRSSAGYTQYCWEFRSQDIGGTYLGCNSWNDRNTWSDVIVFLLHLGHLFSLMITDWKEKKTLKKKYIYTSSKGRGPKNCLKSQ